MLRLRGGTLPETRGRGDRAFRNIEGVPWPQITAGMKIFVAPVVLFTVLVRKHLLRGVAFGTIKQ